MRAAGVGPHPRPRVAVVGAGPKAMALAAKCAALAACGYRPPELVVFERAEVGADWSGRHGYTHGRQRLGTPPEKDVGFPYETCAFGADVAAYLQGRFSWGAYLLSGAAREPLGAWVDRGAPHPTHAEFAAYLAWVAARTGVRVVRGTVTALVPRRVPRDGPDGGWTVRYTPTTSDGGPAGAGTAASYDADAVVVTGPGAPVRVPRQADAPQVLDGRTFWARLDTLGPLADEDDAVCVVGAGETAASVVVELVRRRASDRVPIYVVNRDGTLFTRGESYYESRLFTDPSDWHGLLPHDRRQIIARADRGVFSVQSMEVLTESPGVVPVTLGVESVRVEPEGGVGGDSIAVVCGSYNGQRVHVPARHAIVAIGFDPWTFAEWLPAGARDALGDRERRRALADDMTWDLRLPDGAGLPPCHVPALAGVAQGPGFPNLSCLGTLADRVLRPYVARDGRRVPAVARPAAAATVDDAGAP